MKSEISDKIIDEDEAIYAKDLRPSILKFIQVDYKKFNENSVLSIDELNEIRRNFLSYLLKKEKKELAKISRDVIHSVKNNSVLTENIEPDGVSKLTYGQKLADKIAEFGGSWIFIITFFSFLLVWMLINIVILSNKSFDPYPFILLNLILSCLAAIQAPIIMMSQNRQEQKDRLRAEHDYKINLKAELEIKILSEKMDHILVNQNKKLLEIQEVQIDYLEDLVKKINKK